MVSGVYRLGQSSVRVVLSKSAFMSALYRETAGEIQINPLVLQSWGIFKVGGSRYIVEHFGPPPDPRPLLYRTPLFQQSHRYNHALENGLEAAR